MSIPTTSFLNFSSSEIPQSLINSAQLEIIALETNIVSLHFKGACEVDLHTLRIVRAALDSFSGTRPISVLLLADPQVTYTRESRLYRKNESSNLIACAAVASNLAHFLIYKFYVNAQKKEMPFQLFKSNSEAFDWLREKMSGVDTKTAILESLEP